MLKSEVETVYQTGSTNNGNRYRRTLSGYTYVLGITFFIGVCANIARRFLHSEFQDGGRIPEVVIALRQKTISR